MSRAWMPLFIGDLMGKIMHLNATETGIYLRLIIHCWEHGSIPADDRKLALISHCSTHIWWKYKKTALAFFRPCFSDEICPDTGQKIVLCHTHDRVEKERSRYAEISNKRRAAALQKHTQSQSHLRSSLSSSSVTGLRAHVSNSELQISEELLARESKRRR